MQATSDKTASANFTQTGGTAKARGIANNLTNKANGYAPYYQWGRKDAFRSWEYTADPADGTSLILSSSSSTVTASKTIQNPTTMSQYQANPYNPIYYNAWNATYTAYSEDTTKTDGLEKVVKTVYDPCPVGYTVPSANVFIAFDNENMSVEEISRSYTSNGKTLVFPLIGRRRGDYGTVAGVGDAPAEHTHGFYWSAISGNESRGRQMRLEPNVVNPVYASTTSISAVRASGSSIRPVREN